MKFNKYGKEKENLTVRTHPLEFAESQVFRGLENLIRTIKKSKPEILGSYLDFLTKKLHAATSKSYFIKTKPKLAKLVEEYDLVSEHLDILVLSLNFFLETLGITEEEFWKNENIEFPATNFYPSANRLFYLFITSLVEVIGKEDAMKFYKQVIENYIATYDTQQKGIYDSLETMRESWIRFIDSGIFGRVRIMSDIADGRFIIRAENCEKVQSIGDLSHYDRDLLNVFVCHCHFPLAKLWNENFVLTQEQTIAKGDSYCEYVYHDKRFVEKVEHPPKEFFDEIESKLE